MKLILGLFLFSVLFESAYAQSQKEMEFEQTISSVVIFFSSLDSNEAKKLTLNENGIYILHRIGVKDIYGYKQSLDFSDKSYPNELFNNPSLKVSKIKYELLPVFNCDSMSWSKKGCFVDTMHIDHLLSQIAKRNNELFGDETSPEIIDSFLKLENQSRRVILNNDTGSFVFYLTWENGKWFLSMIDLVTEDCSS